MKPSSSVIRYNNSKEYLARSKGTTKAADAVKEAAKSVAEKPMEQISQTVKKATKEVGKSAESAVKNNLALET